VRTIEDLEIGVMFWAGDSVNETLQEVQAFGVRCGQLGIPGNYNLEGKASEWKKALEQRKFHIETVFCSYAGEDYSSFATVLNTVGLIPPGTRSERIERTKHVGHFAAQLGVKSLACHIGFVPEDTSSVAYDEMRHVVAGVCDACAQHEVTFTLETGQEPARVLLRFIQDVGRENLKVNFDPANMILYGTGNPIEALDVLGKQVISVHCKDGDWPDVNQPEMLGVERPLGKGSVDVEAFISKLKSIGYRGPLCIEREDPDQEKRRADIQQAIRLLNKLTGRKSAPVVRS
jgi:sugar phosphate isomerase/epimerase